VISDTTGDGITIVYTPIYKKGFQKRILEERMFIGRTRRHKERIDEYLSSFKHMWELGEDEVDEQDNVESPGDLPLKGYETYSTLSLEYFDWTYYYALKGIFHDFPALDGRLK
jgi:hypothetical protein